MLINGVQNENYVAAIQHVRRRETIAMTPGNCLLALNSIVNNVAFTNSQNENKESDKAKVLDLIKEVTGTPTQALVSSSGLSIQYAILMGLIDYAYENHQGKAIKIVVPPNCYGCLLYTSPSPRDRG